MKSDVTHTTETTDPRIKFKIGTKVITNFGEGVVVGFELPKRKDYSERYEIQLDSNRKFGTGNPFFWAKEINEIL